MGKHMLIIHPPNILYWLVKDIMVSLPKVSQSILFITRNHDYILQPYLSQYPSGWGSLSLHHILTIDSTKGSIPPSTSYQNADNILNNFEKEIYKLHNNKKHKKERENLPNVPVSLVMNKVCLGTLCLCALE